MDGYKKSRINLEVTGWEGGRKVNGGLAFLTEKKALTCWEQTYRRGSRSSGLYVGGVG